VGLPGGAEVITPQDPRLPRQRRAGRVHGSCERKERARIRGRRPVTLIADAVRHPWRIVVQECREVGSQVVFEEIASYALIFSLG